ncbi:hypothetical protein [Candidatus Neptunichlamydia sp. REUL1]|uniref:hypothetical protein n=1 Tax=Candidatus Neptunichlamydia sp. REUL1 TaxID=3064277 RepID=UPI00293165BA|nr:hypothetical protein [Candidatus Neptunochlamydia sp. REUL1]
MQEVQNRFPAHFHQIHFRKVVQTVVVTAALMAITRFTIGHAQKRTKKPITPFKGNQRATLAYSAASVACLAASMAAMGFFTKQPGQNPRIGPFRPVDEVQEDHEVDLVQPIRREEGREVAVIPEREALNAMRLSRETVLNALQDRNLHRLRQDIFVGGQRVTIHLNLRNASAVRQYLGTLNALERRLQIPMQRRGALEMPPSQHGALIPQQKAILSLPDHRALFFQREAQLRFDHQLNRGPLEDMLLPSLSDSLRLPGRRELVSPEESNPDDFILVSRPCRPCLPEIGVSNEHLFGQNGVLMRLMLFRNLLNEYNHLLQEEGIDLANDHESQELLLVLYYLTNPTSASDAKEQYEQFVDAHEALILAEKNEEVARICSVIARVRMTPRIQSFQNDFVQQHINPHDRLTLQNFSRIFVERNKAIAASDPLMRVHWWTCNTIKFHGAMSGAHYLKINPPQLRNIEDGVYYLRHATPNKYDSVKGVIIDPLYREFLQGADGLVLYAAHQRLKDDGSPENEDVRCQTLLQLEHEEKNLMLLFQSVENTLFKRGARTFEALKNQLIASFYQAEGHRLNRLPLRLGNREGYREKMKEICDFIHQRFFGNRLNVNQDRVDLYGGLEEEKKTTEWQMFIMLFYYYQREGLKADYSIKYVNTGCKDDFDRGGGQNMTTDLMHLFERHGKEIPPEKLEAIMDSVQAPTLQLKGTEPIKYRIHPALCVAELLISLEQENILAIQRRGRVSEVIVEKREHQPAIATPKFAQTLGEYKAILTSLSRRSYTVHSADMIKKNCTMSREQIVPQLERNYANGLMVDGYLYDGTVGWGWDTYPYTIEQIYKELTETHLLSEGAAVRIMNQLEVQIYSQPFSELKKNLEVGELMLRGVSGKHSPISLATVGEEFVVNGQTQCEIVDVSKDGARVASLDVNVTLRIPKSEEQRESGSWSWRVNQIS